MSIPASLPSSFNLPYEGYKTFEHAVVDIETDPIVKVNGKTVVTKLYCVNVRDAYTFEVQMFVNMALLAAEDLKPLPGWLDVSEYPAWVKTRGVKKFIAHFGVSFDFPALADLLGPEAMPDLKQIEDTVIMSKLALPIREGNHSLESWGLRLGIHKGSFDDFSKISMEMIDYNFQDTLVNAYAYHAIRYELRDFSEFSIRIEHKVRQLVNEQEVHGFFLDRPLASKLASDTSDEMKDLERQMHEVFLPQPKIHKVIYPKSKKDGTVSSVGFNSVKSYLKSRGYAFDRFKETPLMYIQFEDFNLGSTKQVIERLQEIGWEPINTTPAGAPKVDEESLDKFSTKFPQARLLSHYLLVRSRNSTAAQWLELVDENGYVHGRVDTLGAITGRMTHSNPNMANIPKANDNVPYGKICRECWTVQDPDKYVMVGCDASSLELRMMCHYMDDEEYTREVLSGDVHTKNQHSAGLPTRNDAKTFIYALIYGAGDGKIGSIIGKGAQAGKKLKTTFYENIPKLKALMDTAASAAHSDGFVYGLDGRKIFIRNAHSALNTLLQGGGAIVCKLWLIYIFQLAVEAGIDFKLLGSIHDEYQFQVEKARVEEFGAITKRAMKMVEAKLQMKLALDSEWQQGTTWASTH